MLAVWNSLSPSGVGKRRLPARMNRASPIHVSSCPMRLLTAAWETLSSPGTGRETAGAISRLKEDQRIQRRQRAAIALHNQKLSI